MAHRQHRSSQKSSPLEFPNGTSSQSISKAYYNCLCENDATLHGALSFICVTWVIQRIQGWLVMLLDLWCKMLHCTSTPRTDWFVCNTPWISPQWHKCIFQKRLRLQHLRVLGCHSTEKGTELKNWAGSSSVRLFGDKPKRADEPERKFPYRPAKRKQIACGRSESGKGLLSRSDVSCCILKHFAQKREVSLLPMGKVNFQNIWDMGTVRESWSISQSAEFGGRRYCFLAKMVMFPRTIKTVWRKSIPLHNTTALGDSMRFPERSVSFYCETPFKELPAGDSPPKKPLSKWWLNKMRVFQKANFIVKTLTVNKAVPI